MRRYWLMAVVVVALPAVLGEVAEALERTKDAPRIGTFDRTRLLIAFYRFEAWDAHLIELKEELAEAKAKGDEKKAKAIEAHGAKAQELAHRQLAGQASLDNIFKRLQEALPRVARDANVCIIIEKPLYAVPGVELIDVTDRLTKLLSPPKRK